MFWFNKNNPDALFCDCREVAEQLCDGRTIEIKPDMVCDVTALPFPDESFWHIVFDPPHLIDAGEKSWMFKRYGRLPKDWRNFISQGFSECWRVLKTNGTLIFKWNECDLPVGKIIKAIGKEPLYGQKVSNLGTHWLCFVKLREI